MTKTTTMSPAKARRPEQEHYDALSQWVHQVVFGSHNHHHSSSSNNNNNNKHSSASPKRREIITTQKVQSSNTTPPTVSKHVVMPDTPRNLLYDPILFRKTLWQITNDTDISSQTLQSFLYNVNLIHVKKTSHRITNSIQQLSNAFWGPVAPTTTTNSNDTSTTVVSVGGKSLVQVAQEWNFSSYFVARALVGYHTSLSKKDITKCMKDPHTVLLAEHSRNNNNNNNNKPVLINLPWPVETHSMTESLCRKHLVTSIQQCIDADVLNGPRLEGERHLVGMEYEVKLEHTLTTLWQVPFETEHDLRHRGTARTPDILLLCPVAIPITKNDTNKEEWKVICWIDSKALFGDVETHNRSVVPQAESYVHRFGPGMVLYWFGHAPSERLEDAQGDIVIWGWDLPTRFKLPTGEITTRT